MKSKLLFLLIPLAIASCQSKDTAKASQDKTDSLAVESQEFTTVEFSIADADDEINAFLQERTLKGWAKTHGFGGEFTNIKAFFDQLNHADTSKGIMLWYNLTARPPRIVLALEPWQLSQQGVDKTPQAPELVYPDSIFTRTDSTVFSIVNHNVDREIAVGGKVTNSVATSRMNEFGRLIDQHPSPDGPFSKSHGGFFQNNVNKINEGAGGLLKRLVSQKQARGIRYYYGLEDKVEPGLNKLRIILVAFDSLGNNIVPDSTKRLADPGLIIQKSRLDDSGVIIQKSIPPGP